MASADYLSCLPISTVAELEKLAKVDDIPDRIFTMLHTPATEVPPKTKIFLRALAHGNDPAPEDDISTEKPILTFNDYSISFKEMAELQD